MPDYHSVAIDGSGRLVIPKSLRDQLGVVPGQPIRASVRDGILELAPEPLDIDLVEHDGILVITPKGPVAPLTRDAVRTVLEGTRR